MPANSGEIVIDSIPSLCAQCNSQITALIVERNGTVYQVARCSEHGPTESEIFSSAVLYKKLEEWNKFVFQSNGSEKTHVDQGAHLEAWTSSLNSPTLGIIDLTNRCNYHCPVCFAGDEDKRFYSLPLDTIRAMLQSLLSQAPAPCRNVQFSGGEPTLHPDLPQILRMAREMGFTHIQVATNGSKFLDKDYVSLCEEMGLHTLYLQFDGMNDDVYLRLRGRRLLDTKITIVENIARSNMRIVLVPTIAASINVDQIGPIFRFALEHSKHITGISIQPAAHVGRMQVAPQECRPFNLADMAIEFGNQTGLARFPDDWFPLNAVSMITLGVGRLRRESLPHPLCDAHCSLGTYFYIDEENNATCLNRFLDMERFFRTIGAVSPKGTGGFLRQRISHLRELKSLSDCFDKGKAPGGLTFHRLLKGLDGWEDKSWGRSAGWFRKGYNGIFLAGMHFMDSANYNLRRLHRCIVQYVTMDGEVVPFFSYNAGLRYRTVEEVNRKTRADINSSMISQPVADMSLRTTGDA